jgi:hypothetical protein
LMRAVGPMRGAESAGAARQKFNNAFPNKKIISPRIIIDV